MVSYQSKHAITCIDQTWLLIVFWLFAQKPFESTVNSVLCVTISWLDDFFVLFSVDFYCISETLFPLSYNENFLPPFVFIFHIQNAFCEIAKWHEKNLFFFHLFEAVFNTLKSFRKIITILKKNAPNFCCNRDFFCDSIVLNYTVIRKPVRDDYDDLYLEHKKRLFMTPTHIIKAKLWLPEKKGKKKKKSFLTNWFLFQVETFVCSRPCRDLRTYAPKTNGPWANAVHAHHTTTTPKKVVIFAQRASKGSPKKVWLSS